MFSVELSKEARRFYERCDPPLTRKLGRCFAAPEKSPCTGNNVKPLKGPLAGAYRYRVGDHRVVYTINEELIRVFVITIAKRGDVYE